MQAASACMLQRACAACCQYPAAQCCSCHACAAAVFLLPAYDAGQVAHVNAPGEARPSVPGQSCAQCPAAGMCSLYLLLPGVCCHTLAAAYNCCRATTAAIHVLPPTTAAAVFLVSLCPQVADLNALAELGKVYQDSLALSAQLRNLSSFRLQQDKVLGRGSLAVVQEGGHLGGGESSFGGFCRSALVQQGMSGSHHVL